MTQENKAQVRDAQANAWCKISSMISVYEMTTDEKSKKIWLQSILQTINEQKRKISKLIDSLPD